jgi:hypothetical protein
MLRHLLYIITGLILFIGAFVSNAMVTAQSGYSRMFDGGTIQSTETECTCSGGTLIEFESYVDQSTHEYIYQPGVTTLYSNYNIFSSGNYFLSTHFPYGTCLVYVGESCETEGNPEGTLTKIGTS